MTEMGKPYEPPAREGDYELPRNASLEEFWRWLGRDLVMNTTRGALAEFLVALAVDALDGLQEGWASHDITMGNDTTLEVKTSGYLQSWPQKRRTTPTFDVGRKTGWDRVTGDYIDDKKRWSDVYVFCLHHHQEKATLDPLVLSQWTFFVLSTERLDKKLGDQKSIGLSKLKALGAEEVFFDGIAEAVRKVAPPVSARRSVS
ncbi:MAG: hypothetical protein OXS47_06650 [Chloroflexota bacterium]|nr:hypothetical protein [Chloroflexota bacterium]